jgi:hypothetical protein
MLTACTASGSRAAGLVMLDFRTFTSTIRKPGELRTLPDRRPPEA